MSTIAASSILVTINVIRPHERQILNVMLRPQQHVSIGRATDVETAHHYPLHPQVLGYRHASRVSEVLAYLFYVRSPRTAHNRPAVVALGTGVTHADSIRATDLDSERALVLPTHLQILANKNLRVSLANTSTSGPWWCLEIRLQSIVARTGVSTQNSTVDPDAQRLRSFFDEDWPSPSPARRGLGWRDVLDATMAVEPAAPPGRLAISVAQSLGLQDSNRVFSAWNSTIADLRDVLDESGRLGEGIAKYMAIPGITWSEVRASLERDGVKLPAGEAQIRRLCYLMRTYKGVNS